MSFGVYTVETGRMAAQQQRFRDHTIALFHRHGFRPEWDDLASRERSWAAFLSDPVWITVRERSTVAGPLVLRSENRIFKPTDFSILGSSPAPAVAPRDI